MKRTLLVALAALAALPAAAPASFPGRNGEIVYGWTKTADTDNAGNWMAERSIRTRERLVYGCLDSSLDPAPRPAACDVEWFRDPAVSPDGSLVAFDTGAAVALVGMDGSGFRTLPTPTDDSQPAFSPSGRRLAFVRRASPTAPFRIWVRDLDTGRARPLVAGSSPDWSVRGWIAFLRDGRIHRIRPDGSGLRRLTRFRATAISWAPDGERIALTKRDDGGAFVMRADGTAIRRIARGPYWDVTWSSDGRRLALRDFDLLVVGLRGRELENLGEIEYSGAYSTSEAYGIDWAPSP